MSGVNLNLNEFTDIRFGLDRRLEEVARMLCSSVVPIVKGLDREMTYVRLALLNASLTLK